MKLERPFILSLAVAGLLFALVAASRAEEPQADPSSRPSKQAETPAAAPSALPTFLGPAHFDASLGRYVAAYGAGRAVLTLSAELQERLTKDLSQGGGPWGVTVLLEPATGRVLAMAEHSGETPGQTGLALKAIAPAASIFKMVTAAALLEHGISPGEEVCFHGGSHRLDPRLLADDPRRDRRCTTLEQAFSKSTNVVFAKLADRGLDAPDLRTEASRFLFNAAIPFEKAVEPSTARIEDDAFQLANTAAGFGPVRLSPIHAALLAAIVANGGVFVPPVLVDEVQDAPSPPSTEPWRVVDGSVAQALAAMMRGTVTDGTARRAFRRASTALRAVQVAGKTGSLADKDPYRDYTWFIGFAPADAPEVAVATVIANDRRWRVRAPAVARAALEAYFKSSLAHNGANGPGVRTARASLP